MALKILCLYPNIMDLYGDNGNIEIIKYRSKERGIDVEVDTYTIGDPSFETAGYDLIFMGGGSDKEQELVAKDIVKYKDKIRRSINSGTFYLLICGGYQLFGKYYKNSEDNMIEGLNMFNYYTISSTNKNERCIGDIIISTKLNNEKIKIVGFENHGGQTYDVDKPFANVLYGNGNTFKNNYEGYFSNNVIGTYLHGPLLSKNPELADYIIKYCMERKYNKKINLRKLDDSFEKAAKEEIINKYTAQLVK